MSIYCLACLLMYFVCIFRFLPNKAEMTKEEFRKLLHLAEQHLRKTIGILNLKGPFGRPLLHVLCRYLA